MNQGDVERRPSIVLSPSRTRPVRRKTAQQFMVQELVQALYQAFCQMQQQQQTTLLELGDTPENRFELSCQVAHHLYMGGIGSYGSRVVQMYLREGEIQAMFFNFLCGDRQEAIVKTAMEQVLERLCGLGDEHDTRKEEEEGSSPPHNKHWPQDYRGDFLKNEPAAPGTPAAAAAGTDDSLSSLSGVRRARRRDVQQGRSQRDPRRTGRCHERPVSALLP